MMENNMFKDYIEGYVNVHNELLKLDVTDKTKTIERLQKVIEANDTLIQSYIKTKRLERMAKGDMKEIDLNSKEEHVEFEEQTKQYMENIKNAEKEIEDIKRKHEENIKRKEQLENAKKSIRQRARADKEERIGEEEENEKKDVLLKQYDDYAKQIQEIKEELKKFEGIELETTQQELARIDLERQLREKEKEQKIVAQQINQKSDMKKRIEKEYILFLGQLSLVDKSDKAITIRQYEKQEKEKDENTNEKDNAKREDKENNKANLIASIEKDIEKYKILMEKYKNNEEKVKDFKREIERLENEKKKLLEKEDKRKDMPRIEDKRKDIPRIEDKSLKGRRTELPIRSFWEIYNSTNTEHVGSIAHMLNKWAHMKVLPDKNEDTLQKALSVALVPMKAIIKGASILPNKLSKTDQKIEEIQKNIDTLSQEEFRVLVEKSEELNKTYGRRVKDPFDTDYLEPQFMKQYKVNNAYLDVVRTRLGKENGSIIEGFGEVAKQSYAQMQELRKIDPDKWSEKQVEQYNECVNNYQVAIDAAKDWQTQIDVFDEGAKKKSSSHRNISGWLLAKFNPDNRNENAQMAELAKKRREAFEAGDLKTVHLMTGKMQQEAREQTVIKGGERNYIDIGKYSLESPVETLDKGQQNKGRLLLSNIAIATSIVGVYNQMRDNIANNEQLRNVEVRGEAKISDSPEALKAEEAITRQSINAGFDKGERANLDGTNWRFDEAYRAEDAQIHQEAAQITGEAQDLINQKNNIEALEKAVNYYNKVNQNAQARSTEYLASHPQFDYSAFTFGSKADMNAVVDFFKNGKVPFKTNVNLAAKAAMPALKQGIDYTAVVMAMGNALYQAQKQGTNNIRKTMRVDNKLKKEEDKETKENTQPVEELEM